MICSIIIVLLRGNLHRFTYISFIYEIVLANMPKITVISSSTVECVLACLLNNFDNII